VTEIQPIAVLSRTLDIIRERGWTAQWSSGPGTPLNIRSAVSLACTDLVGTAPNHEWYELYRATCHAIGEYLSEGIIAWEFEVKSPAEVEAMLATVLQQTRSRQS
jgi:hypothetical protein